MKHKFLLLMGTIGLTCLVVAETRSSGIDKPAIDATCKPCEDFFQYANGSWIAGNPIPPQFSRWSKRASISQKQREGLRDLLEAASKGSAPAGSNERKIGDFYAACMATDEIDRLGVKPAQALLDRVGRIESVDQLQDEMLEFGKLGYSTAVGFGGSADRKDPTKVYGATGPAQLGLPERDYYLKQDDRSKKIREDYSKYIASLLKLAGEPAEAATEQAGEVLAFETKLAEARLDRVTLRDPRKTYNPMTGAELKKIAPTVKWEKVFGYLGRPMTEAINVTQPAYLTAYDKELTATPLTTWKRFVRWQLLRQSAGELSSPFVQESFNFRRVLTGAKELPPRWQRCVEATDNHLGEALGQVYVQKYFPPEAKKRMLELVENLRGALRESINDLEWMTEPTKKNAVRKLDAFVAKIGYPDKWRDYSGLQINSKSYYENVVASQKFEVARRVAQVGKNVDKTEWFMSPATNNAYYSPLQNEIVFPAAILQWPMFQLDADDAVNYGAIGMVIGHEMSHGFDDSGSRFSATGAMENWWTEEDRKKFDERSACIVDQFNNYFIEPNVAHNGKLVLGESIGDLGGITIAYRAWKRSLKGKPEPQDMDGFTPDQRFFMGVAQSWAGHMTPEQARLLVATDPHPVAKFRVNGPLSNMPEFAKAFSCKQGEAMVRPPEKRCKVW